MIIYTPAANRKLSLFTTPFDQHLSANNRWVRMEALVPWDEMAKVFFNSMSASQGRPSVDLRIVLGVLMVKHIEDLSDERTIEYVQENIYAQFFVGLSSFQTEPVFVPHLLVTIRKRLSEAGARQLNDLLISAAAAAKAIKHRKKPSDGAAPPDPPKEVPQNADSEVDTSLSEEPAKSELPVANRGTLIVDATVAPLHIAYPTDSNLLNDCRLITERLIDCLYEADRSLWPRKPRTYRREATGRHLSFSKKRRKTKKDIRRAVGRGLNYLRRNLKTITAMLDVLEASDRSCPWSFALRRQYWIVQEIYRQQNEMHRDRRRRVDNRIVSVHQPHVRPIKRGKGGSKNTEFGPKINASVTEGFARADQIDFSAFNEANHLVSQVKSYRDRFGYYPGRVLADQIYWNRKNRKWLKERNIHIGGVPLGPKRERSKYEKERDRKRNNQRSEVEGKFGEAKERYGMKELYTRLPQTTKAEVSLIFLAMNLVRYAGVIADRCFDLYLIAYQSLRCTVRVVICEWFNSTAWILCSEQRVTDYAVVNGKSF